MKESPASTDGTSVIVASEPQVFVADLEAASAFYVHKLGFTVLLSYGEPPFYAQIARDGGRLNLRRVSGPVFDRGFRSREADALSATFTLGDAKPLFLEFQKAGVAFHQTLSTEPWGARTFIVQVRMETSSGRFRLAQLLSARPHEEKRVPNSNGMRQGR